MLYIEAVLKLTTSLPNEVKSMCYVKNHHYIELEDCDGNKVKLNAIGILVGTCISCKCQCVALSNQGNMWCTHCGGPVKWSWTKPQISFLPEHESKFMGIYIGKEIKIPKLEDCEVTKVIKTPEDK